LQSELDSPRPLISEDMQTDGTNIFVERIGSLINVSANGQLAMKALLIEHLKRIDRDKHGVPVRLSRSPVRISDSAVLYLLARSGSAKT
jgi:hypothetical protein